ncbi:MAG: hypothetical protein Q8O89_02560 [Nanoarchaeota archaeon]|nr:hypothetical protein [Nanoarchaeota archaeon]
MKIKLKIADKGGATRIEADSEIKEVLIEEDFASTEKVAICHKSGNVSGIIEMTVDELEELNKHVKKHLHLIKGMKKFKVDPSEVPF